MTQARKLDYMDETGLQASIDKMTAVGVGASAMASFVRQYAKLASGATGLIPEASIEPLLDVPAFDGEVPADAAEAMRHMVVIKLNGGLGTSMGMTGPKSLLPVRAGRTFLDLIVTQVLAARRQWDVRLPLLLMNSFATNDATAAALEQYPGLTVANLPLCFVQSKEPKLWADTLQPAQWPADPELEWCPPGHGDIYGTLHDEGLLDTLIEAGYWYAFVSNADNLGAVPSAGLASWFARTGAPYMAEVCRRTVNDKKGGHLARRLRDGRLILRDTAQTAPDEMDFFTDENRHPFFHSNNLWWDLRVVKQLLADGQFDLPLIRNVKTIDPTDKTTPAVIQIETAMGTAIELFEGAQAVEVPRDRFVPVKKTNELLLLRSDVYTISDDGRLAAQAAIPLVDLGPAYQLVGDFDARIPSAPSCKAATSLVVKGDWTFGRDITVLGEVHLDDDGQAHTVPDGAVLKGAVHNAQEFAAIQAATAELGLGHEAAQLRRPGPLSDADRRLIAEVPPHHGKV